MATFTPAEAKFVDWFKARGGTVHGSVGFKQFEGMGRGAVALQDIEVSSARRRKFSEYS
jgi:SET domain-containing protein 6